MAIIYIRQKRGILGSVTLALVIVALAVATYFILLYQSQHLHSTPKVSSVPLVALAYEAQVPPLPDRVGKEQFVVVPELGNTDNGVVDELPPLPKYGMDAMGAVGAWDSTKEVDEKLKVDDHGNACVNIKGYTTAMLRTMLPPKNSLDACDYFSEYRNRADQAPADVLANNKFFDGSVIRYYFAGGQWSVSDVEQLARRDLSPVATLNVYLFLRQANSPVVEYLLGRQDNKIDHSAIHAYFRDGGCSPEFGGVGLYCLLGP